MSLPSDDPDALVAPLGLEPAFGAKGALPLSIVSIGDVVLVSNVVEEWTRLRVDDSLTIFCGNKGGMTAYM